MIRDEGGNLRLRSTLMGQVIAEDGTALGENGDDIGDVLIETFIAAGVRNGAFRTHRQSRVGNCHLLRPVGDRQVRRHR